ncbi:FMN-binding protein [Cellulomonas sp. H30R-01]|uniref:FMN-binding protein n=1 Tax=Cellulomonas sp. H30R-01 TaxID=2704467 RepID=UPI00138DB609|nr:FMN-binding protein [Cellulomonas sp. H30R-01]QHT55588.1 FMN-binding protein [Cellulomonas sp. H30R-01]
MRRILALTVGTVAGLVALFAYPTSRNASVDAPAPAAQQESGAGAGVGGASSSGGSSTDGSSTGSSGTAGGSSDASSDAGSVSGTFTGAEVQTRWGPVQVQIVVQDGRITSADAVTYPDANGHDRQINAYAIPQLDQEVVQAQGASIDLVSGATVTSDGYVQSLQDAIDQAFS